MYTGFCYIVLYNMISLLSRNYSHIIDFDLHTYISMEIRSQGVWAIRIRSIETTILIRFDTTAW